MTSHWNLRRHTLMLLLLFVICWMTECSGNETTVGTSMSLELASTTENDATIKHATEDEIYVDEDDKESNREGRLLNEDGQSTTPAREREGSKIFSEISKSYQNYQGESSDLLQATCSQWRPVFQNGTTSVSFTLCTCETDRVAKVKLSEDGRVHWFLPSAWKLESRNSKKCIVLEVMYPGYNAPEDILKNLSFCESFLQCSEFSESFISIGDESDILSFPYHKSFCHSVNCSTDDSHWKRCKDTLGKIQINFPEHISVLRQTPLEYLLMPTVLITSIAGNYTETRAKVLANLWIHDLALLRSCHNLFCCQRFHETNFSHHTPTNQSSSIPYYTEFYDFQSIYEFYEHDFQCLNYSTTSYSVADQFNVSSFNINETKTEITVVFEGGVKHYSNFWRSIIFDFHHRTNPEFKFCCNKAIGFYNVSKDSAYFYCYGTTENLCSTSNASLITKSFRERTVIVMRGDDVDKEILKSLKITNTSINPSLVHEILDIKYFSTTDPDDFSIIALQNNSKSGSLYDILLKSGVHCNSTQHLTVCVKKNPFPVYWVFIGKCSLARSEKDKLLLLLINWVKENQTNVEDLCKNDLGVLAFNRKAVQRQSNCGQSSFRFEWFNCHSKLPKIAKSKDWSGLENKRQCSKQIFFIVFPLESTNESDFNKNYIQGKFISHGVLDANNEELAVPNINYAVSTLDMNPVNPIIREDRGETRNGELQSLFLLMDLIFHLKSCNYTHCIRNLVNIGYTIYTNVSEHLQLVMGPNSEDNIGIECLGKIYEYIFGVSDESYCKRMITINKFWPSCWYDMLISWEGNETIVTDWDYLPRKCKIGEIFLISLSFLITSVTVIGNSFVLLVLIASGSLTNKPYMIHASMAVADLLLGVMPGSLAVYDQVSLVNGQLTYKSLSPCIFYSGTAKINLEQAEGFIQLRYERLRYPMLCSIMLTISVTVSLFSLVLFSIERLWVIRGKELGFKTLRFGICVSWILGTVFSLLFNYRQSGFVFVGYFDPITKITMNIPTGHRPLSTISFYIQLFILSASGLAVMVFITASVIIHIGQERETQKKLLIHCRNRKRNVHYVTQTFICMVILFVISTIPVVVDILADLGNNYPVLHFICWWMFMGGISGNWAVYSLRGSHFREKFKKVFNRFSSVIRTPLSHPQNEKERYELSATRWKRSSE